MSDDLGPGSGRRSCCRSYPFLLTSSNSCSVLISQLAEPKHGLFSYDLRVYKSVVSDDDTLEEHPRELQAFTATEKGNAHPMDDVQDLPKHAVHLASCYLTILWAPSLEGLFLGTGVSISPRKLSRDRSLVAVGRATCPEGPTLFLAGALAAVAPEVRAAGR